MNYRKIIIDFMWEKDKKIRELGDEWELGDEKEAYMSKDIEEYLDWIPDDEIEKVFISIDNFITTENTYEIIGLHAKVCPFCVLQIPNCEGCFYGMQKGKCCKDKENVYDKILSDIRRRIYELSMEWYEEIWENLKEVNK